MVIVLVIIWGLRVFFVFGVRIGGQGGVVVVVGVVVVGGFGVVGEVIILGLVWLS